MQSDRSGSRPDLSDRGALTGAGHSQEKTRVASVGVVARR